MDITRHGNWKRGRRITLRLTEQAHAAVASAAADSRHTVAETITHLVNDWLVSRDLARKEAAR
jgi:hypothetical protein